LDVQSETLEWYGHFLISVGRSTEGVDSLARALQLNPRSLTIRGYYIDALRAARRYEKAFHEARLENSAQLARNGELYEISELFFDQGRFEDGLLERAKERIRDGARKEAADAEAQRLVEVFRRGGPTAVYKEWLAVRGGDWNPADPNSISRVERAAFYAGAGLATRAEEELDRGVAEHDLRLPFRILTDLRLAQLRHSPGYETILRRLKLPY
jgi:hypothetical protein